MNGCQPERCRLDQQQRLWLSQPAHRFLAEVMAVDVPLSELLENKSRFVRNSGRAIDSRITQAWGLRQVAS